jgi:hypothetical protein
MYTSPRKYFTVILYLPDLTAELTAFSARLNPSAEPEKD